MKSRNINYKENKDIVLTIISILIILLLVAIIAITIILVRKNINTKTQNEETLAKDKTINLDNVTNEEKSAYIIYNNLLCRVLYNDEVHGLQIITNDNVGEVSLGSSDNTVTADEFIYAGTADVNDNFKKAAASYNNAVELLNEKAKEYKGEKALDARSVGSIAILENGKFKKDIDTKMWRGTEEYIENYKLNDKFKNEDTNYKEDVEQINLLGLNSTDNTWFAS